MVFVILTKGWLKKESVVQQGGVWVGGRNGMMQRKKETTLVINYPRSWAAYQQGPHATVCNKKAARTSPTQVIFFLLRLDSTNNSELFRDLPES